MLVSQHERSADELGTRSPCESLFRNKVPHKVPKFTHWKSEISKLIQLKQIKHIKTHNFHNSSTNPSPNQPGNQPTLQKKHNNQHPTQPAPSQRTAIGRRVPAETHLGDVQLECSLFPRVLPDHRGMHPPTRLGRPCVRVSHGQTPVVGKGDRRIFLESFGCSCLAV